MPERATSPAQRKQQRWTALTVVAVAWIAVLLLRGTIRPDAPQREQPAPAFEVTTLEGEALRLADLSGRGVVLNFWASWCLPCRAEAELLEEAWQRHRDSGIVFVGIAYLDTPEEAQAFVDEYGITYDNALDDQGIWSRRYALRGVPETFFIAPDGTLADTIQGPILTAAHLDRKIRLITPSTARQP